MKRFFYVFIALAFVLASCQPGRTDNSAGQQQTRIENRSADKKDTDKCDDKSKKKDSDCKDKKDDKKDKKDKE